jgi:phage terminase small subunit
MTIHELCVALQSQEPEHEVFVALYVEDTAELFDIEGVRAQQGHAELEIYAEEEADDEADGNGAVRGEQTVTPPDPAEAAEAAFLDFCARRAITEEEKDLIWNAMAFICYDQVQRRHGPFYEAIRPFLAGGA